MGKELIPNYRKQYEELYKAEAPTWETHGNLMVFFFMLFFIKLTKSFVVQSVLENVCADAVRTGGSLGPRNIKIVFCLAEHTFAQKQSELFETYSSL